MTSLKRSGKALGIFVMIIVVTLALTIGSYGLNPPAQQSDDPWLWKLLGDEVVVVFDRKIPELGRAVKAKFVEVGRSGIVLEWGEKETYYTFANIIMIRPAKDVKWGALTETLLKHEEDKE